MPILFHVLNCQENKCHNIRYLIHPENQFFFKQNYNFLNPDIS